MPIRPENRHRYPSNWPEISREIRFTRAAGRCECLGECGRGTHTGRCPNVHDRPAYGTGSNVVLTTAHLDHTPENCDDTNLRAMCQGCHLHYDRHHHAQTAAATRRAAVDAAGQLALATTEETTVATTHAPRRIQRKRSPGWTLAGATDNPNGAVIVDRTSRYGNPFTIDDAEEIGYENPRSACVGAFDEWLSGNRDLWQSDDGDRRRERILSSLHRLRGRDLACTCGEADACHADVLIRRANAPVGDGWLERVRARVARNRAWRGEEPLPAAATPCPDNGGVA